MEFLRRRIGLIIRCVVSLLAVWYVVRSSDWHKVWHNVQTMDYLWLAVGIPCFIPTLLIVSWRWRMLLRVHGVQMRFWRVFELTMIGQFFSTVGVGTTGGDVFKIFYVARAVPDRRTAVAFTVLLDRVIGMVALLFFGAVLSLPRIGLLFSKPDTRAATMAFYVLVIGGFVGSICALLGPYVLNRPIFLALGRKLPMADRARKLFLAYDCSARAIGTNIVALVGSLPSHMSIMIMAYCIARAMNLPIDLIAFCAILAIINMLIALPVSVSGVGVRETLFKYFFPLIGISPDQAVTFSLTYFALNILWSLAGGPFYFLYRHETHTPPPNVDEVQPILEP
jgi:glycosyltransferase 2 family protein